MDFRIFDGISEFVSDAYYGVTSAFDSGGSSASTFNYTSSDDYDDNYTSSDDYDDGPSAEVLGFYEMGDMGQDLSAFSSTPTYQERLYEESGGDLYYSGEYDNRSLFKQAQDFLYKSLDVDEETAKLIKGFAGAAGAVLKGQGGQGGQRGQASQNAGPRSPAARMLPTRPVGNPGVARSAQLAGLSPRAQAAMNAMAANGGKPVRDLSELIAGTNTPKGRTIANPSSLRGLNIRQSQYV